MANIELKKLTKLYYSIGEVADMLDVNPSLLRFWEKEFKGLQLKKSKKGNRQYTVKDIELLDRIYSLVKIKGFTLDGAKNELKKKNDSETILPDNTNLISKLDEIKNKLISLKSNSN